jgi:hypothetical protein
MPANDVGAAAFEKPVLPIDQSVGKFSIPRFLDGISVVCGVTDFAPLGTSQGEKSDHRDKKQTNVS